jgi:hypothetical protein
VKRKRRPHYDNSISPTSLPFCPRARPPIIYKFISMLNDHQEPVREPLRRILYLCAATWTPVIRLEFATPWYPLRVRYLQNNPRATMVVCLGYGAPRGMFLLGSGGKFVHFLSSILGRIDRCSRGREVSFKTSEMLSLSPSTTMSGNETFGGLTFFGNHALRVTTITVVSA